MSDLKQARLPGGRSYESLLDASRRLLDAVAWADAPDDVVRASTTRILAAAEALGAHLAPDENLAPAGNRPDLQSHGHPGLIPITLDRQNADEVLGRVTFRPVHIGGGAAVHGGNIPLLFDDVLGWLAATDRPPSRTAYLHVNYRQVTPLGVELQIEARIDRIEGRKIFAVGRLLQGEETLADAEGLFVLTRSVKGMPARLARAHR